MSRNAPWTTQWMRMALSDQHEATIGSAISLANLMRSLPLLHSLWVATEDANRQLPVHPAMRGVRAALDELARMDVMTFAEFAGHTAPRQRRRKT